MLTKEPTYPFNPSPIQGRVIKGMLGLPGLAVFVPPGMGKTACAYSTFRILNRGGMVKRALVISPLRPLYFTWPAENRKWEFNLDLAMLHGSRKLNELRRRDAQIYLINPEGVDWLELNWKDAPKFDMLVVDESSKFRNTNSRRHHLLKRLLKHFDRRYIMTGTPAPNGLINLFGQMMIVDGGLALGKFITHYRVEFFQPSKDGYGFDLQEGGAERIYQRVKPISIAVDESEYANLPRLIEPPAITIQLPPKVRKFYDQLEDELYAVLEDGTGISAKNAGVLTMKLRQVANGGIYSDESKGSDREFRNLHYEKARAVADLVDELQGQPALIAFEFHHDLARLREVLPDAPWISSGVSLKRQKEILEEWDRGRIPALLGQPQSMAHGLNMQKAGRAIIWHSHTWDLEMYEQMIRRIWRTGQQKTVFNYRIVADSTVDEDILNSVKNKAHDQRQLLQALKLSIRKRRRLQ